jgi:hypothetical protein
MLRTCQHLGCNHIAIFGIDYATCKEHFTKCTLCNKEAVSFSPEGNLCKDHRGYVLEDHRGYPAPGEINRLMEETS